MENRIKYLREIQVFRSKDEPELLVIKAKGIADILTPFNPVLVPRESKDIPSDGIMELDFKLDKGRERNTDVKMEVEIVIRVKNLPSWVQGFRINAEENSDIELI